MSSIPPTSTAMESSRSAALPLRSSSCLRGILRPNCLLQRVPSADSSCNNCKVRFSEAIDEHVADDWDRSKCSTAVPTMREIRELMRIRHELVPDGRGISDQDDESEEEVEPEPVFYFDDYADCDERPKPQPKKRLRNIPIELCPLLPAVTPTPAPSNQPSPLNSPPHGSPIIAPLDGPIPSLNSKRSRQPRAMMTFLPILPPSDPPTPVRTPTETPIPTPPETPTMLSLTLSDDPRDNHHDAQAPPRHHMTPNPPESAIPPPSPTHITREEAEKRPSYAYQMPTLPSRPPPTTCRMTILPLNPQRQNASPVPDRSQGFSQSFINRTRPCMTSMNFMPVNVPTTTAAPFTMSFKATTTARTY